ncbi:flagellar microtugule protofilament ribbon protein, putative [Ichthyophthirius multifiliis]|uniref:Flagellar microtugule protofilament ribbon protein, putative n=1 Tax=Ichthyophthirius multifiliis TaxID=5932 RepID=G0QQV2_ICHMU|nr:flagellar microtugule protofilament ribbon protein, putative [Ichthyophthirius multifiliis]EGR32401.1 flagellar microtugule protofilament ribbon protein, putative [Ichthyophthirius multifiliis]|eukprot:XP_004036385.1 flagellar microtugule protofilament ribbon protein, putative [Ichthyophthirius multifiliis]
MKTTHLPRTIPLLPGHMYEDLLKENHHKIQQFTLINNVTCEKTNYIEEKNDPNLIDNLRMGTPLNLTYGKKKHVINDYIPRIQPPWLKYDRQVLRFNCYFQESVVEDPKENYRIRKCTMYYYLSDGTIHVNEPRIQNSGIVQGIFIKRQKIPKVLNSTDNYYTWEDLNIGVNVNLFERVFRITDCDQFTQEFYNYMGVQLNQIEPVPEDNFQTQKRLKEVKIPPPDVKEYNEYNEVKLGGGHPNGGLQQYLENDRKVLSFNVLWNDNTLEGGINYYILNFYLSDDSIELKEIRRHNSGKDSFPMFLNKKKMPKIPIQTYYPGMTLKKEEFYKPEDLLCGQTICLYSKDVLIFDCDEYTKEWYLRNLNYNQIPISLKKEEVKKFYSPVPPYTGYGTEEDSLGSVYSLQPKAPRKDINKIYTQDQYILRYEARLISQNKDDNIRKFIITFYNGDDTLMVYETSEKNSGIWRGKFLERMRHKNNITGKFYTQSDFQIGEIIQLNEFKFQLLSADEYTHNYMRSRPEIFREADIEHVIFRLKNFATKFGSYNQFIVELIKNIDQQGKGLIDFNDLVVGFKKLGFNLSYQEIYTLMRYFTLQEGWKLDVRQLFQALGGK